MWLGALARCVVNCASLIDHDRSFAASVSQCGVDGRTRLGTEQEGGRQNLPWNS